MLIEEISFHETMPIRQQVLWPDLPITFCSLPDDELAWHYGAWVDDQIVSVASLFVDGDNARLRKFATHADYQGRGIGTAVFEHIIEECQNRYIKRLWFDAREEAVAFYQRFGFVIEGDIFYKKDIPYWRMSKNL